MAPRSFPFFFLYWGWEENYISLVRYIVSLVQVEEVKKCQQDSEALAIQENREFSISVLTRLNENT